MTSPVLAAIRLHLLDFGIAPIGHWPDSDWSNERLVFEWRGGGTTIEQGGPHSTSKAGEGQIGVMRTLEGTRIFDLADPNALDQLTGHLLVAKTSFIS